MTRSTFLQSIAGVAAAAIGTSEPVRAEEFNPEGKHYVLTVPDTISLDNFEHLHKRMNERFPGCKITILTNGLMLHEIRPLGTADIEAAVERAVRKALITDAAQEIYCTSDGHLG